MTYQRNTAGLALDVEKDVADEPTKGLVGDVEEDADDGTGDDDDDRGRGDLAPTGPLDLLQLADRLRGEGAETAAAIAACARLSLRLAAPACLTPAGGGPGG